MLIVAVAVAALWPATASAQLGALVSPGRLSKAHAQLEGVSNCLQCHSKGQQVTADKCLTCHKPIAARMAAKIGVHRAVTTDCVSCHVEHAGVDAELRPFDQTRFDHGRDAGYPLDGLHAPVAATCAACHKTRSFLTATPSCASCHTDSHKGALGPTCTSCHSTSVKFSLASRGFDHSKARFPLKGAHAAAACETCHKNKQFTGLTFGSCSSCHADPHKASQGPKCETCHNETTWRTTTINHARTAFPLKGLHAAVTCAKCHSKSPAITKVRSDTCATCHTDPHRGVFAPKDCAACHTESGFERGSFDHASTTFALRAKHLGLACIACHKTETPKANDFRGLAPTCASCHADVHRGELGTTCETCHTAASFTVTSYTHTRPRDFFAGQHAPVTCQQCHDKTVVPTRTGGPVVLRVGFTTTATACVSCHTDVHLGQVSATCERCHSVDAARFAVTGFSHAATTFPLTGAHAPLACATCHKVESGSFPSGAGTTRRFTGLGTACATCHADPHQGQLTAGCETCHTTETFGLKAYTHRNARGLRDFFTGRHQTATCDACHRARPDPRVASRVVANYQVTTRCTTCHVDVHKGALGPDCASCHKP